MSELEDAERRLAASLVKVPQEQAISLVCGAIAIAFGDHGLKALCEESQNHLKEEEGLERGLR